jgi:hypothetical protein
MPNTVDSRAATNPQPHGDVASKTAFDTGASNNPTALYQQYKQGRISRGELIAALDAAGNQQVLSLCGMVVDQYGQPVVGAKVKGSVLLSAGFDRSEGESYYTETDSHGRFRFVRLHGLELGIWPQKDGYDYDLKLSAKRPDNYYKADPGAPVIFTMWKVKGAEPMIHAEFDSRIPYNGTSTAFDLATGKRGVNGNLRITLLRDPLQIQRGQDKYSWTVRIEIVGGGILEEHDLYPRWAPEDDYHPSFESSVKATDISWTRELAKSFYIKDSQGRYGRVFVDLFTDSMRPDTGIKIQAWINPSGSQNLEFDPAKQIR